MVVIRGLHLGRLSSRNEITSSVDRGQTQRAYIEFHRVVPGRNQVIRNLEVAKILADGRNFAVLVCAECPVDLADEVWERSLPHLTAPEITELKRHYLGCATWPMLDTHFAAVCPCRNGWTMPLHFAFGYVPEVRDTHVGQVAGVVDIFAALSAAGLVRPRTSDSAHVDKSTIGPRFLEAAQAASSRANPDDFSQDTQRRRNFR